MSYKKDMKDQRRGGFYWVDARPFVTVTTVLKVLDKPALRYWFGKEVYLAMVKDPTLSEQVALAAPYEKSDKAKDRGLTVHSIVESYKHTKEHIDGIPEDFRGYAQAFYDWVEDNDIEMIDHERTVISQKYNFAGTLDLMVKFRKSNKTFIIDIKTGKDIYPEAFLQLSAYKQALSEEGVNVDGIAVLLLMEDGRIKYAEGEDSFKPFYACKVIWDWQNKELLEKMNTTKIVKDEAHVAIEAAEA